MELTCKYTEQELLLLLKAKDENAFGYLYETYSGGLYSTILQIIPDEEQANLALQETFTKIWFKIGSYDSSKMKFFTWMLNLARKLSLEQIRSKTNGDGDESAYRITNQLVTLELINNTGLRKALRQLKTQNRALIDLAYFKGYTQEEIAKMEDLPLPLVKTGIRNALIQLREFLK